MLAVLFSLWSFTAIASERAPTDFDLQRVLWSDFQSHLDGMHAHEPGDRGVCLTGLVQRLRKDWHVMTAEQRRIITETLAPSRTDLFEPRPVLGQPAGPPPPTPASDTCWESTKDNRIDTEHFSVQWDDGIIDEEDAQDFADSLEESWEIEVGDLGWKQPNGSDRYLMRIEVERMGNGAGAYTSVDSCGGSYLPYVVASAGSFRQGDWYKTMACHELHHAIQYAYGFGHEFWWWEATATWVEDHVYPYANDWANALYMFSQSPHLGMNAFAGRSNDQDLFWHTYGMGIWGMFLDQKVGGNELVRKTWEVGEGAWCQYCLWMPDVIEDVGEDFDELFADFLATTAVLDFRDRNVLTDVRRADRVTSLPNEGDVPSYGRPQSLGMNIIEFTADLGEEGKVLEVNFNGSSSPDYWVAVLVRGSNEVEEQVVFDIDERGDGMAYISFEGDRPVHLVVSPVDEDAQGYEFNWQGDVDFSYSWTARVVAESDVGSALETDSSESQSVPIGEFALANEPKGCSCASTQSPMRGWALVGIVCMVLGIRRRD